MLQYARKHNTLSRSRHSSYSLFLAPLTSLSRLTLSRTNISTPSPNSLVPLSTSSPHSSPQTITPISRANLSHHSLTPLPCPHSPYALTIISRPILPRTSTPLPYSLVLPRPTLSLKITCNTLTYCPQFLTLLSRANISHHSPNLFLHFSHQTLTQPLHPTFWPYTIILFSYPTLKPTLSSYLLTSISLPIPHSLDLLFYLLTFSVSHPTLSPVSLNPFYLSTSSLHFITPFSCTSSFPLALFSHFAQTPLFCPTLSLYSPHLLTPISYPTLLPHSLTPLSHPTITLHSRPSFSPTLSPYYLTSLSR